MPTPVAPMARRMTTRVAQVVRPSIMTDSPAADLASFRTPQPTAQYMNVPIIDQPPWKDLQGVCKNGEESVSPKGET